MRWVGLAGNLLGYVVFRIGNRRSCWLRLVPKHRLKMSHILYVFVLYVVFNFSTDARVPHRLKREIAAHGVAPSTPNPSNRGGNIHGNIEAKFQVNKNSIIRTHDSRALGAKYINETDLSSNEECLRWCWNTTNCNLAVFEEKVSWKRETTLFIQ